jgi:hypothetical protein
MANGGLFDNGRETAIPFINGVRCQYKFRLWTGTPLVGTFPFVAHLMLSNFRVARDTAGAATCRNGNSLALCWREGISRQVSIS